MPPQYNHTALLKQLPFTGLSWTYLAGSGQELWELFLRSWELYKTGMNIPNTQATVYLFNCLDQDLRDDIMRANPSTQINMMSEADLIASVKSLAVKMESKKQTPVFPLGTQSLN